MRKTNKRFPVWWAHRVVPTLLAVVTMSAQTVVHSFDGDHGPGAAVCETGKTHCGFPDMNAAVNGKQVVQVTWQHVLVYDYKGNLLRSTPLDTFIRDAGLNPTPKSRKASGPSSPGPFEPTIVYDEFIGRWIMTMTGNSDTMLVSADSDPMGPWGGVNIACGQGGPCLKNNPAMHIGYDKNGVYYCGGHIGESNPHTIEGVAYDCFALPPEEVKAIAKGTQPAHLNRMHNMTHEVFPAVDQTPIKKPDAPAYFLAKTCDRSTMGGCQNATNYSFEWVVSSFAWNGASGTWRAGGNGEQLVKTDIGSKQNKWLYNKPCCGPTAIFPQAGSKAISLRGAEAHRLTNLTQSGSHLYGVMGSGPCIKDCGAQGADAKNIGFFVDLDCSKSGACIVNQTAKLAGDFNVSFATVGVDAKGNVGIVAASATATTDLSILMWTRRASDPPNTFAGPSTVIAGTKPYTCETDKDFASLANPVGVLTVLDPGDRTTLWTSHHWANSAERCVWNTRIIGYQIDGKSKSKAGR
jgi:hypothetical protein